MRKNNRRILGTFSENHYFCIVNKINEEYNIV